MHLIHNNLSALASVAAKDEDRYSVCGVRLSLREDGGYRAEATDLKILARVESKGFTESQRVAHPLADQSCITQAPNGAAAATIPSANWKAAMKAAPRKRKFAPQLRAVACVLNEQVATLASSDCETRSVEQVRVLEGRFPDADAIIPVLGSEGKKPVATVVLNAEALERLLAVARDVATGDGICKVTLELRGENSPVVLRAEGAEQTFTGVIMPLTTGK